ncbi:hypothetical protein CKM354_001138900 [Cercospora kikuchii]|uniref:Oxidase ustYa n=1 Tax=Cercospora kikuchii TaxID=84275 RepID=A0A9P3CSW3_9PEZI|nr:uncharacterized protein CKM354_001138900 [Cercospora kikuchii]GIZ48323.1 hypothetical protein CKM354_001138900 [Cercospora kikuchii]
MAAHKPQNSERLLQETEAGSEQHYRGQKHSSERPWRKGLPWILTLILSITVVILVVQLLRGDKYQHTGDVNGLAPRFKQRVQLFHPSKEATASIGHPDQKAATDAFWRTFAPDGFGLLNIADYTPKRYPDLAPPTFEPGGYNLVDTSMAHQLHCLRSIMDAYNDLAEKVANNGTGGTQMEMKEGKHHDHSWHLGHCFDYIRQGIMCCGDTALDGAATTFPDGIKGSDGWNAKHVCKDYEEVKGWIVGMEPK